MNLSDVIKELERLKEIYRELSIGAVRDRLRQCQEALAKMESDLVL